MRTFVIPALALALVTALMPSAASAQSWADIPSWERRPPPPGYPPPGYYPRPPRPSYRPPAYDYPGYGYRPPRPSYARYSNMCVTSRGTCSTGRAVPVGSPCRCFIPGFGQKRGAVEAAY